MTKPVGEAPVKPEKKVEKKVERTVDPKDYYCEIILERTTKEKAEDKSFPTDAFNVRYIADGKEYLDVTRAEKMVYVFNMYYDGYGKGSILSIDYGAGSIRPNLWGIKPVEKKKRRK